MSDRIEALKKSAEEAGIEGLTYEEQAEIALELFERHGDPDAVYSWFEDRYDLDYPRERTKLHVRRVVEYSDRTPPF